MASTTIRYSDWDVSKKHVELIKKNAPRSLRVMDARKSIPGVNGKRVSDGLKAGVWTKPLGSRPGKTFSCVQDMAHISLVVFAQGSSTSQATSTPDYDALRTKILGLFHNRRATGLDGEIYSLVSVGDYDIDDAIARELDIDIYEIASWFREDRENDWLP